MVGHFLHPNRKSRASSDNSSGTTSGNSHAAAPGSGGASPAVGATMAYSPHSAMPSSSRYANNSNSFDVPSMAYIPPQNLTAEAVAALPPPGLSGPSAIEFSPRDVKNNGQSKFLVFVSTSAKSPSSTSRRLRNSVDPALAAAAASSNERQLSILDLNTFQMQPLLKLPSKRRFDSEQSGSSSAGGTSDVLSLEERLRRERQRLHSSGGLTQFCWTYNNQNNVLRLLVPIRGSLYVQDGLDSYLKVVYDKHSLDHVIRSAKLTTWRFLFYLVLSSVCWSWDSLFGNIMSITIAAVAVFNTYVLCRYPGYRKMREKIAEEEDKRIEARISKEVKKQAVSQIMKK